MAQSFLVPDPDALPGGLSADRLLYEQIEAFTLLRRPKQTDYSVLKQMFYSLIGRTSPSGRRKFSIGLAHNPYTPRQLVLFLALETIDIATPVLLYSPCLSERDLVAIVERKGEEHGKIIARRSDLTLATVQALRAAGDAVAAVLARNPAAPKVVLERRSAGPSAADIPDAAAGAVQPLSAAARPDPTTKSEPGAGTGNTTGANATEQLLALAGRGGRLGRSEAVREAVRTRIEPDATGRAMLADLRAGRVMGFCQTVERTTGLSAPKLAGIIKDQDAGVLASLFHLMQLPKDMAARLLLMLCPRAGSSHAVFSKVMARFETLDDATTLAYFQAIEPGFSVTVSQHHLVAPVPEIMPLLRERRSAIARHRAEREAPGNAAQAPDILPQPAGDVAGQDPFRQAS